MAKKTAKKASKKATKKNVTMVAGREVDTTPVEFGKASIEDFNFTTKTRTSSKYYNLIQAAIELEEGECLTVDGGDDLEKTATNIRQVMTNKARPHIEKGYKIRIRTKDEDNLVVIGCFKDPNYEEDED